MRAAMVYPPLQFGSSVSSTFLQAQSKGKLGSKAWESGARHFFLSNKREQRNIPIFPESRFILNIEKA
jgi:hypothetical protein